MWKYDAGKFINWCLVNDWKQGLDIDRIDNDGDYNPNNCRFVTHRENSLNKRFLQSNNKSGYRGVSWHKRDKKWVAEIQINDRSHHLGYFQAKEAAALAYNQEARKHGYPLNEI